MDNIISSGRDATSLLSSVEDCSKGVAPVFDGGTLKVAGAGELDSNFVSSMLKETLLIVRAIPLNSRVILRVPAG